MVSPFIIGVAGGSASGKNQVCTHILEQLITYHPELNRRITIVSLTDFYRDLTIDEMELANCGQFNHDHPDAIDWKLLDSFLCNVSLGIPTKRPCFDFVAKKRTGYIDFPPTDVILFEGTLVLYKRKLRERMAMCLFVDVDCDVCLSATVIRDTLGQRNRQVKSLEVVLNQWLNFVKPCFEEFILPTKKYADVIIPRGFDNKVALNILIRHIDDVLTSQSTSTTTNMTLPIKKTIVNKELDRQQQKKKQEQDESDSSPNDSDDVTPPSSTFTSPIKKMIHPLSYNLTNGKLNTLYDDDDDIQ